MQPSADRNDSLPPVTANSESTARLGILGGMGPAATADFFAKLTRATPATNDQEHIPTIVCSLPDIPDRNAAILENGPSPIAAMSHGLEILDRCGATCIAIPCNTAHYWFDQLQLKTSVPILHIVDAVVRSLMDRGITASAVGLLATSATIHAGVYRSRPCASGYEFLSPDDHDQVTVMNVIRLVKAGHLVAPGAAAAMKSVVGRLQSRGARVIVVACSELPLVVRGSADLYIDATASLAEFCVNQIRRPPLGICCD